VFFDMAVAADDAVRPDVRAGLDDGGEMQTPVPPVNGAAWKRRSMMSRWTCMYLSGVPMSIQ
jgi:hypothetical protein